MSKTTINAGKALMECSRCVEIPDAKRRETATMFFYHSRLFFECIMAVKHGLDG